MSTVSGNALQKKSWTSIVSTVQSCIMGRSAPEYPSPGAGEDRRKREIGGISICFLFLGEF